MGNLISNLVIKDATIADSPPKSVTVEAGVLPFKNEATRNEDEQLVIRCLRNDRQAWTVLFQLSHPRMVAKLSELLGQHKTSLEIAQDIAAQVWLSVISDDGRLLRKYDATTGARLSTYLNGIAVKHCLSYLRQARRRLRRESQYYNSANREAEIAHTTLVELHDFAKHLTPTEATFFHQELVNFSGSELERSQSDQNVWQLRHRIRNKLVSFLRNED